MKLATSLCSQGTFVKKKKKLFSHDWCWELDAGNSTLDTHKESRGVWKGDKGEDAVMMGVKRKTLCYTAAW